MAVQTEHPPAGGIVLERQDLLQLFSVLSHDLKSPIFAIDGFSDLLLSEYGEKLDEEGRDFLERVRSSVGQLKRTLEEMSRLVKLLGRPAHPERLDLGELIDEVRLKSSAMLGEGQLEVSGSVPSVWGDAERIREVLSILVSNALTFNERPESERRVEIKTAEEDGEVRVCVEDNGVGVDPRFHDQIFEMGLKLDKSVGEGPGYGLWVARRIVEDSGGRIEVRSSPDEGSRFCFVIPRNAQPH